MTVESAGMVVIVGGVSWLIYVSRVSRYGHHCWSQLIWSSLLESAGMVVIVGGVS